MTTTGLRLGLVGPCLRRFFKVRFQGKMYTLDVVCFLEVQLVSWQPVVGAVDVGRLHHQQGAGRLTLVPHTEHYHGGS